MVSPVMTLKDHFYWKSQQQFKMDYIFFEKGES